MNILWQPSVTLLKPQLVRPGQHKPGPTPTPGQRTRPAVGRARKNEPAPSNTDTIPQDLILSTYFLLESNSARHRGGVPQISNLAGSPISQWAGLCVSRARQIDERSAGWETRDTADLEVCGTKTTLRPRRRIRKPWMPIRCRTGRRTPNAFGGKAGNNTGRHGSFRAGPGVSAFFAATRTKAKSAKPWV
jgi:hypothetical protein